MTLDDLSALDAALPEISSYCRSGETVPQAIRRSTDARWIILNAAPELLKLAHERLEQRCETCKHLSPIVSTILRCGHAEVPCGCGDIHYPVCADLGFTCGAWERKEPG